MDERTQHAKFVGRLFASRPGVSVMGYWFNSKGFYTEIPPTRAAPTAAQHRDFIDNGDLFVWKSVPRQYARRIEVKTLLRVTFSGKEDWPFKEVFVSSVKSVDRCINDAYAWISLSNDYAAAVAVETSTRATWYRVTKRIITTGNDEEEYAAPLSVVKFFRLFDEGEQ